MLLMTIQRLRIITNTPYQQINSFLKPVFLIQPECQKHLRPDCHVVGFCDLVVFKDFGDFCDLSF